MNTSFYFIFKSKHDFFAIQTSRKILNVNYNTICCATIYRYSIQLILKRDYFNVQLFVFSKSINF